jgi:hypothetical protein
MEDLMKGKTLLTGSAIVLAGWFALASGSAFRSPAYAGDQSLSGSQSARNGERDYQVPRGADRDDQWYQGQRGHWRQDHNRWQWRGAQGDQWYMGQPGHWYSENNGWQFGSQGTVCNDQGRNCRQGGNAPANGEGMVSRGNPNFFWACDSDGHHCRWARRPGY